VSIKQDHVVARDPQEQLFSLLDELQTKYARVRVTNGANHFMQHQASTDIYILAVRKAAQLHKTVVRPYPRDHHPCHPRILTLSLVFAEPYNCLSKKTSQDENVIKTALSLLADAG
jgi:hypothetical protein